VSELARTVPVSQPAVSQHLRALKEAMLVQVQKQGQQRLYSLDPRGLAELRAYVEGLWEDVLGAFQQAAKEQAGEKAENRDRNRTEEGQDE
jgi:DNA-binding transcriptional ArsR family regulator